MPAVLVTGGAGFIGSHLVDWLLANIPDPVVVLDRLDYAGLEANLEPARHSPRFCFVRGDVADQSLVRQVLAEHQVGAVVHLAALTHVDRSIDAPSQFVAANTLGTARLLEEVLRYWSALPQPQRRRFRFVHMSTDEVYGSLGSQGRFGTEDPLRPNSPYAASKAAADHVVQSFLATYGLPVVLVRACNNYGPRQFPEKLVPLMILRALDEQPLPVYGSGENVREWIHVHDTARGLGAVLSRGEPGRVYHLGSGCERSNLEIVRSVCRLLDRIRPRPNGDRYEHLIRFVSDRPGHDFRYALASAQSWQLLHWQPETTLEDGLEQTIRWYLDHPEWVERTRTSYQGQRLGLGPGGKKPSQHAT